MAELNNKLPKVYDLEAFKQFYANILHTRAGNKGPALNVEILKSLRIMDEQDAINMGKWFGCPYGLNGRLMERIMYYKARAMMFLLNDRFYFLPFANAGTIDVYGRYTKVTPLPFNGSTEDGKVKPLIEGLTFEPIYDIALLEEMKPEDLTNKCVILDDYSQQISQHVQSRSTLQEPLLQVMSEIIPFMRTALINGVGVNGIKVNSADEAANVLAASDASVNAALLGDKWIPIQSSLQTESLDTSNPNAIQDYLLAMQSLDNFRLSFHGIDNGGLFQKEQYKSNAENAVGTGIASLIQQDKVNNRQDFCMLASSLWGINMWYEVSEPSIGMDMNGDGIGVDDGQDQTTHNEDMEAAANE